MVYEFKNFSTTSPTSGGASEARDLVPFLFKAFETGKQRPPAPGTKDVNRRAATIHEFLDWTILGDIPAVSAPYVANAQDFWGFRILTLVHRYRPAYPHPGAYDYEVPPAWPTLGGPRPPLPVLMAKGRRPVTAATIRAGRGYLEVPFFATVEHRKGQGFGRALLEAIEEVCRALGLPYILLCSENAKHTKAVWEHMGFAVMPDSELTRLRVTKQELLHMDNTVQMYKRVPPRPVFRSLRLQHAGLVQRVFFKESATEAPTLYCRVAGNTHVDQCGAAVAAVEEIGPEPPCCPQIPVVSGTGGEDKPTRDIRQEEDVPGTAMVASPAPSPSPTPTPTPLGAVPHAVPLRGTRGMRAPREVWEASPGPSPASSRGTAPESSAPSGGSRKSKRQRA